MVRLSIKQLSEKVLAEEVILPELWVNQILTEAQKEIADKGDEAEDFGVEMVNYE